ncbi:hypothetical protein WJX73_000134 [Symbiochloris irregularis]|uniref:Uncharacterized protein n=1 Tax=Symbiochloris irregularis TaxID=706552 RepID=A0AAW1NMG3_9CHLO
MASPPPTSRQYVFNFPPPAANTPPAPVSQQTAVAAVLALTGNNVWPFTDVMAGALVRALGATLSYVNQSGIGVTNWVEASRRRRLLAPSSVLVDLELDGANNAVTPSIEADLQNVVINGELAAALKSQGLSVSAISLLHTSVTTPSLTTLSCQYGSVGQSCISQTSSDTLSSGAIAGIIVAACVVGAVIIFIFAWYCFLRSWWNARQKDPAGETAQAKPAMTPMGAQPFWLKGRNIFSNSAKNTPRNSVQLNANTETPTHPAPFGAAAHDQGLPLSPEEQEREKDLRGQHYAEHVEMGAVQGAQPVQV